MSGDPVDYPEVGAVSHVTADERARAAQVVRANAKDAEDAAELLAMLGLPAVPAVAA